MLESINSMRLPRLLRPLLYPPACLLCRRRLALDDAVLCGACEQAMPLVQPPFCQRCGLSRPGALDQAVWCARCRQTPTAFAQAHAPFLYAGRAREAVHAFKYAQHHRVGRWLALHMARVARQRLPLSEVDGVVPVPSHWLKRRLRGAQPSALLAHTLAASLQLPYRPAALARTRWTASQTRLTPAQRARNVQGAFRAARIPRLRRVVLVDDVFTTGATAQACAAALRAAGVETVWVLTAAVAPRLSRAA